MQKYKGNVGIMKRITSQKSVTFNPKEKLRDVDFWPVTAQVYKSNIGSKQQAEGI